jgi:hypothetical protein
VLEHFEVGYSDRTLSRHLPKRQSKPGQRFRSRLMELGIMRQGTGQEHMGGRVVVPVRDESERVVGMYGRTIHTKLHEKVTPKHKYLPGPRRGVLNWKTLVEHEEVILCESPLDAMTFWTAGFRNVTSSWGANGFSAEHLAAFRRHGVRRVLVAYDRDEAGEKGAGKVAETLLAEGIECFRVLFPRGLDANAYALEVKPVEKSLGLVIRQAQWMGKGRSPSRSTVVLAQPVSSETSDQPPRDATPQEEPADEPPVTSTEPLTLGELAARQAAEEKLAPLLAASSETVPEASPAPPAPECDVPCEVRGEEVVLWLGDRRYRVRGLEKNLSHELLDVNLLASRGDALHVDKLDLYSSRKRRSFVEQAAAELGLAEEVVHHDLKRVLLRLELLQRERLEAELRPEEEVPAMTPEEREEALAFARDPRLVERILEDLERCGVVGEETNKLLGYLALVSRWDEKPLAVLVQSSSAAGKSALLDAWLALLPEELRISYSAVTGQSLFYMGEKDLKHKVLAIAEEEGAERASYALKLLQSEGELTIASTGKDPHTGRLVTQEYRVEGPVMIFLTTTAVEVDEELLNRCIVLTVDEGREQTRAIHERQRAAQTLEGLLASQERSDILELHQNAQRLLRPLLVANPFARELTFLDHQTRSRRDHMKYLTLIRSIALVHQYQREVKTLERGGRTVRYIEVSREDIRLANLLAAEVLGRTLDELPPQTRRLLGLLDQAVTEGAQKLGIDRGDYHFSRRQVREWTSWSDTQLRVHLGRLVELEYLVVHRGGRGQRFVYELCYAGGGEEGAPFLPGLIDPAALGRAAGTTLTSRDPGATSRGGRADLAGGSRVDRGPIAGGTRDSETTTAAQRNGSNRDHVLAAAERSHPGNGALKSSYRVAEGLPSLAAQGGG